MRPRRAPAWAPPARAPSFRPRAGSPAGWRRPSTLRSACQARIRAVTQARVHNSSANMAGKYGLDWDREETDHMTTTTRILFAAAALALPFAAAAQSNDAKYCKALSDTYRQTVAKDTTPNADVPWRWRNATPVTPPSAFPSSKRP